MNSTVLTKPKSNKTKLIVIIAVIVLGILAISGGAYAFINSNPKTKVLKGIKATADELEANQGIIEKVVGKDYMKTLEDKGIKGNGEFILKTSDYLELNQFKGSGVKFDYAYDEKNKKMALNYGAQYKGTKLIDAKFYTDNKKLMVSAPELYDAWFTCDAENIQDQYNNSELSRNGKMPNQEVTLKLFDEDNEKVLKGKELMDEILKGYLKENAEKLATIGKNIKVEKSKESKKVEVGGVSQECAGYDVVISGQDAKDFVGSIYDYILKDEELKKTITKSVEYSYLQQKEKYDSPEGMVKEIYNTLEEGNKKFKEKINCDDVKAVIFLDKKGRAVSIDLNTTISSDLNKVEVKYTNDFKGKDNLGDLINASVELSRDKEKAIITFDNTITNKDDLSNQEINITVGDGKSGFNVATKLEYNTKSGDFDASANMGFEKDVITIAFKGNSKFDKSSKKLDLDFDNIDLKANMENEQVNISLDGAYSIAPLDSPIEEPNGEKLEVFKLNQNKFNEIALEIQGNAMKIANTLN